MGYPLTKPYDHGLLEVGQNNQIYWETCGNPSGYPVVVLHGGPGSGCAEFYKQFFDPTHYRIILLDQRGCGRSLPHAGDMETSLAANTTHHLISDLEVLRKFLHIDKWLVFGMSWGTTLALAYSEENPSHVSALVLSGITMTRPSEIDWLYRGVAPLFPAQWERFLMGVAVQERNGCMVQAYSKLLNDRNPSIRQKAARNWHEWEAASLSINSEAENKQRQINHRFELARARIVTHYFRHNAWLEDGVLLKNAHKLGSIPGAMVQGRLDLAAPMATAWELSKVWPSGKLIVVPNAGHSVNDAGISEAIIREIDLLRHSLRNCP